jgi:hypothetical protein
MLLLLCLSLSLLICLHVCPTRLHLPAPPAASKKVTLTLKPSVVGSKLPPITCTHVRKAP